MERYTYFDGGKWRMRVGDAEYSGKETERLAAYEETGLEPEEIMEAVKLFSGTNVDVPKEIIGWVKRATWHCKRLAELTRLVSFDRLRQLAEAEKEGRLVVLQNVKYTDSDGEKALRHAMYMCGVQNNPVTRYTADAIAEKLTREAAEAALDAMGGENNA